MLTVNQNQHIGRDIFNMKRALKMFKEQILFIKKL